MQTKLWIMLFTGIATIGTSTFAQNDPDWCDPFQHSRINPNPLQQVESFHNLVAMSDGIIATSTPPYRYSKINIYTETGYRIWVHDSTHFINFNSDIHETISSIDTDGQTVVVGIHENIEQGLIGKVVVFKRVNNEWIQDQVLTGQQGPDDQELFGSTVVVENGIIAVGAPGYVQNSSRTGAMYIFKQTESSWSLSETTTPPIQTGTTSFGTKLAISNQRIVVGFGQTLTTHPLSPLAHVYALNENSWTLESTLHPHITTDPVQCDSLAIDNDTIIVGSIDYYDPRFDDQRTPGLIFERDGSDWTHTTSLVYPDEDDYDYDFRVSSAGTTVKIHGNRAMIAGTPRSGYHPETLFVYQKTNSNWSFETHPIPRDDLEYGSFGLAHDFHDDMIISTHEDTYTNIVNDEGWLDSIDVYSPVFFDLLCDYTCYADLNNDDRLDFFDFTIFRNAYMAQDPIADFHRDGNIDLYDFFEFMIQFNRGFYEPDTGP